MKIKNEAFGIFSEEMQTIYPNAGLYIKKVFPKGDIIFKLKILFKYFGFENKFFLEKIDEDRKDNDSNNDIPDKMGQESL